MPAHPQRFWLAAIVVAWSTDVLFWDKPVGISIVLFVALAAGMVWWIARSEAVRPAWTAPVLVLMALAAAGVTLWRADPLTRVLNGMLAFGLLGLLVVTLRSDRWLRFGVLDWLANGLMTFGAALTRGSRLPLLPQEPVEGGARGGSVRQAARRSAPVIRGVLLAIPVLFVFGALLASADPIFSAGLNDILKWFDLDRFPEYFIRLINILVLAYLFAGVLLHAVSFGNAVTEGNAVTDGSREASRGIQRFLGSTEALIVLGSVTVLFAAFVVVQFRYFFGGQANITAAGFTYSEYARRGFFELVTVAVLSLAMIAVLGAVTRREQATQARVFTVLSGVLVALVWVMLISAYLRLQLYEEAYGFTRLRTYTHLFIPWLGLLLLVTVLVQVMKRERYFMLAVLMAAAGFTLTLGIANVDRRITEWNIRRAGQGAELDAAYLVSLSDDAIAPMADHFEAAGTPPAVRDLLGAALTCRTRFVPRELNGPWQGYHPGMAAARKRLDSVDLSAFTLKRNERGDEVVYGSGQVLNCTASEWID